MKKGKKQKTMKELMEGVEKLLKGKELVDNPKERFDMFIQRVLEDKKEHEEKRMKNRKVSYHAYSIWVFKYDTSMEPTREWYQQEKRYFQQFIPVSHDQLRNIEGRRYGARYLGVEKKGANDWVNLTTKDELKEDSRAN